MSALMIRGGTLLDPSTGESGPGDLLVVDGVIRETGDPAAAGADVIDATERIVLPGFVDTHRHTWQSGLRGILPDVTLQQYLELCLRTLGPAYTPEDVALGNLVGALECLDAGITTVFDWSHLQLTPAHTDGAIDGLRRAGIRALFGYARIGQADSRIDPAEVRRVAAALDSDPLLDAALGAAGPEMSDAEQLAAEFGLAREHGLRISAHVGHTAESSRRGVDALRAGDHLGADLLLSHANGYDDEALKLVADTGGAIAVSPTIEPVMGHGFPVTGRAHATGMPVGLGADVVTSGPGDLFSVMRAAYLLERSRSDAITTRDVLRMATIDGARAVGKDGVVGSLRPGSQADLVLLRTDLAATAPVHDPVATVVLAADTRAVDTVLVGGRVVKRDGVLAGHDLASLNAQLRASIARVVRTADAA